jgi:hypothetical protein
MRRREFIAALGGKPSWMLGGMPLGAASNNATKDVFDFSPRNLWAHVSEGSWSFWPGDFSGKGRLDIVGYESKSGNIFTPRC